MQQALGADNGLHHLERHEPYESLEPMSVPPLPFLPLHGNNTILYFDICIAWPLPASCLPHVRMGCMEWAAWPSQRRFRFACASPVPVHGAPAQRTASFSSASSAIALRIFLTTSDSWRLRPWLERGSRAATAMSSSASGMGLNRCATAASCFDVMYVSPLTILSRLFSVDVG
eukprot:15077-Chlamydomonas_euryale.AAC.2